MNLTQTSKAVLSSPAIIARKQHVLSHKIYQLKICRHFIKFKWLSALACILPLSAQVIADSVAVNLSDRQIS